MLRYFWICNKYFLFIKLYTCQTIIELTSKYFLNNMTLNITFFCAYQLHVYVRLIGEFSVFHYYGLVIEKKKVNIIISAVWPLSSSSNCLEVDRRFDSAEEMLPPDTFPTLKFLEEVKRKCASMETRIWRFQMGNDSIIYKVSEIVYKSLNTAKVKKIFVIWRWT